MENLSDKAAQNLAAVREKKPLIHNITNYVVMNYTANALLAMGASPVMAHAVSEVEEMVSIAGALVLNIGTLAEDWIASMIKAGQKASELGTPIILDPVGSGATSLRTNSVTRIIRETSLSVIRGNPSEILSLRHNESKTKGVDAVHSVNEAGATAKKIAEELNTTIAITGPADFITNGERVIHVSNGHPLMARVTGTGCTATVIIAAFSAVDDDPVSAAATGLAFFGLAGEAAGQKASGPGSFMIEMLNALYEITPEALKAGCKIREE
ncbi:hydroxyethylthiazole kinase [Desulfonema magnum]|uniref:Hydroxyethylthiazole kinase n=1 Tax=Desulfonema magnum TaxID=45655 RepID=A0A975BGF9_9BACT|nr:hydroxyethylthiazole kinase [Desulfonema magnum]QTA85279.1 Hydroxyethylthiazole kinase [Desulfonema magnum]